MRGGKNRFSVWMEENELQTGNQRERERGQTPTQRLVKRFIPLSCMRKTNGQDPREWEETVPTSWRGEQVWRGSGLLASQSLPQLTNGKLTKGGGGT